MLDRLSAAPNAPAISSAVQTGRELSTTDDHCPNGQQWFTRAARDLLGSDPGYALSVLTGVPERSCYRYAKGERELPLEIFRLLRDGSHGEQFFRAFMADCTAKWWIDFQRHERAGRKAAHELSIP